MFSPFIFVVSCLTCATAFYLPGSAPVTYCEYLSARNECKTEVPIFVNRLTSLETVIPYEYDKFDLCSDTGGESSPVENLGQVVFGDRIRPSPYKLKFKKPVTCAEVCTKRYPTDDKPRQEWLDFLKRSIELNYNHNWIIDDMPITWCYMVEDGNQYCSRSFPLGCYVTKDGKQKDSCVMSHRFNERNTYYFFNHVDITIQYHPGEGELLGQTHSPIGRIISAKMEPRSVGYDSNAKDDQMCSNVNPMGVKADSSKEEVIIRYTYSVKWQENLNTKWSSRWDYILASMPHTNIQLFNIMNSVVIVMFLSGVVAMIMRRIARYNQVHNSEKAQEKFGWRLVHGDIFRPPRKGLLLAVLIGNGVQIFFMTLITLVFASVGFLSPANPGALMTCSFITYVCLGTPAGYVSARIYKSFGGEKMKTNMVLTAFLCQGFVFGIFFILNLVHWTEGSSAAIPYTTLIALLGLWFGISVPLTFIGAYFGCKKRPIEHPVQTSEIPRKIPHQSICRKPLPGIIMGGVLPFGCIFIQLFFILNSIWAQQVYYMFGFLFLVFVLLIITCSEVTILLCYFHLCTEYYHWWWRSFLTSGFTAVYSFIYCVHYYITKLELQGGASTFLYFGYTLIVFILFFLLTGSIGFFACFWFIRKIYSVLKVETNHPKNHTYLEKNSIKEELTSEVLFETPLYPADEDVVTSKTEGW